jgi:VanZ family protein
MPSWCLQSRDNSSAAENVPVWCVFVLVRILDHVSRTRSPTPLPIREIRSAHSAALPSGDLGLVSLSWLTLIIYAVPMSKRRGIEFFKRWLPVLLWAGIIAFFSTDHFSAPQSSRILGPLLHWLFPDIAPERLASIHFAVRKLGHWLEYFILAVLLYRALYHESRRKHSLLPAAWTIALALVWAAIDEFHQSLVPSRTASFMDVMIDGFGGLSGTFWMYLRHNRTQEPASQRNER